MDTPANDCPPPTALCRALSSILCGGHGDSDLQGLLTSRSTHHSPAERPARCCPLLAMPTHCVADRGRGKGGDCGPIGKVSAPLSITKPVALVTGAFWKAENVLSSCWNQIPHALPPQHSPCDHPGLEMGAEEPEGLGPHNPGRPPPQGPEPGHH